MYLADRAQFESTAQFWTQCYARPAGAAGEEVRDVYTFIIIYFIV
jgi:hypothetical protein